MILRARSISCGDVVGSGISEPVEFGWALELAVWESFPVALVLVLVVPPEFAVAVVALLSPSPVWVSVLWPAGDVSPWVVAEVPGGWLPPLE